MYTHKQLFGASGFVFHLWNNEMMSSRFVIWEIPRIQNLPAINFSTQSMTTLRNVSDCV